MTDTKAFLFETEFTRNGEILSGAKPAYKRVEEVEREINLAREQTQSAVMGTLEARIAAALENIAGQLTRSRDVISQIALQLRNDAIELALASAKIIAGKALDENGVETATQAVAKAAQELRAAPELIVSVAPDAEPVIALALRNMPGLAERVSFAADPAAQPGDWRISFENGAVEFNREAAIQTVEDCLNRRQDDPVEDQLDLFGASAA